VRFGELPRRATIQVTIARCHQLEDGAEPVMECKFVERACDPRFDLLRDFTDLGVGGYRVHDNVRAFDQRAHALD